MSDPSAQGLPPDPRGYGPRTGGRPGLATVIGAVVMLLPLAGSLNEAPHARDLPGKLGALIGSMIFGLIVWAVCYAITIKRAPRGWKIGSLILLLAMGLINGMVSIGRDNIAREDEAKKLLGQLKAVAQADPATRTLDAGPNAGPFARFVAAAYAPLIADARALATEQKAVGLNDIVAFDGLTHSSLVLDHCDQVAALGPKQAAFSARYPSYLSTARAEADAAVGRRELTRGEADAFLKGMTESKPTFERQNLLATRMTALSAQFCRILARRNWVRAANGNINFNNNADLAAAQPLLKQLDAAIAEVNASRQAYFDQADKVMAR